MAAPMYMTYLGNVAAAEDKLEEAQELYEQALTEGRAADFPLPIGLALDGLGRVARKRGDRALSRVRYEEAVDVLRAVGDTPQMALMLVALAHLGLEDGDPTRATSRFREALEQAAKLGHRESLIGALEGTALALVRFAARGRTSAERALRLIGAAERLREATRLRASDVAPSAMARARQVIGDQRAQALLTEGRILSIQQAVAQANVALADVASASRPVSAAAAVGLTPREREVAILLAHGYSNQSIAETLVVGRRTAEMHVSNLLSKLGFVSRAQLAVRAVEHGLLEEAPV
jgi:DNA-binding CsgD family transcriptional regulator